MLEYPGSAAFLLWIAGSATFVATHSSQGLSVSISISLTLNPLPQPLLRSSKDGPRSTDPQPARSSPHKQACIPQCCQGFRQQPRGQVNWAPCRRFPLPHLPHHRSSVLTRPLLNCLQDPQDGDRGVSLHPVRQLRQAGRGGACSTGDSSKKCRSLWAGSSSPRQRSLLVA